MLIANVFCVVFSCSLGLAAPGKLIHLLLIIHRVAVVDDIRTWINISMDIYMDMISMYISMDIFMCEYQIQAIPLISISTYYVIHFELVLSLIFWIKVNFACSRKPERHCSTEIVFHDITFTALEVRFSWRGAEAIQIYTFTFTHCISVLTCV